MKFNPHDILKQGFILIIGLLCFSRVYAQPANDHCANPTVVPLGAGNFGLGVYASPETNLTDATIQFGEHFNSVQIAAGNDKKSIWYKFTLPTARAVNLELKQTAQLIPQADVGFTLFKTTTCLPGTAEIQAAKLTPLNKFGSSYNPCLDPGEYLVQVSSKASVNNPIFIEITTSLPTILNQHDFATTASAHFAGTVSGSTGWYYYDVGCQTISSATETCGALSVADYTQSTWHVFRTDAAVDALRIYAGAASSASLTIGMNIYQGDVRSGSTTLISGCNVLTQSGGNQPFVDLVCNLMPNTFYTIQLFYHKDAKFTAALRFDEVGIGATTGHNPMAIPASNQYGVLPASVSGTMTQRTDRFSCNADMALTPCPSVSPAAGITIGSTTLRLNTWFTFELAQASNVNIVLPSSACNWGGSPMYVRLFRSTVGDNYVGTAGCNGLTLYSEFWDNRFFRCMPAGRYSMQVLGIYGPAGVCTHFGKLVNPQITVYQVNQQNNFDLKNATAIENVNGGLPLPLDVTISTTFDRFGCLNSVLPAGDVCNLPNTNTKAIYRRITINQNGVLIVGGGRWWGFNYRLYRGDAGALATAQGILGNPAGRINGLTDQVGCQSSWCNFYVCVTPGIYTLVTFGDEFDIGEGDNPWVRFTQPETQFANPATPDNLGTLNTTFGAVNWGQRDQFSCIDNPLTIAGRAPCVYGSVHSTKQIYREFFLPTSRLVTINNTSCTQYTCSGCDSRASLFSGRISQGVGGLVPYSDAHHGEWTCFSGSRMTNACHPLPAGWYTVVAYQTGKDFTNPAYSTGNGDRVGWTSDISVTINTPPPSPLYNTPAKAALVNNGNPITWFNTGTAQVPKTGKIYNLASDNFDCNNDLPFPMTGCTGYNRTVYHVFSINQVSYLRVLDFTSTYRIMLWAGDAKTNPAILNTSPIQSCIDPYFYFWPSIQEPEFCNLQPGSYTLVIFANNSHIGLSIMGRLYIDEYKVSKYDFARNAYDFGEIPNDNAWYGGKVGDPVSPEGRSPSTDFFYCSTGATTAGTGTNPFSHNMMTCFVGGNPSGTNHSMPQTVPQNFAVYNNRPRPEPPVRRNLWYTFVIDGPGRIYVRGNTRQHNVPTPEPPMFAVYESDVDGTLDFATLVTTNQVDSTITQGLTFIKDNYQPGWWCPWQSEMRFERDPCTDFGKKRYYIVVEGRNYWWPNIQIDMQIRFEPFATPPIKYDFCSGNPDPDKNAYNFGALGSSTTWPQVAPAASFACATRSVSDPTSSSTCANRTLWYRFTNTDVSGRIRLNFTVVGQGTFFNTTNMRLFRGTNCMNFNEIGLNTVLSGGQNWGEACLFPGEYYIILTGCSYTLEEAFPRIQFINIPGDFCSTTLNLSLTNSQINTAPPPPGQLPTHFATGIATVDCHTIGEAFGENGSNMGCLFGPSNFKSTWFRVNLNVTDKVDLSFKLSENSSALPNQIRYRVMYGDCNGMTAGPCNSDALTEFTLNCMQSGDYYVQVISPANTIGTITLNSYVVRTPDQSCEPLDPTAPTANFTLEGVCVGSPTTFVNQSTQGPTITYLWQFGDPGSTTSTHLSPSFTYPSAGTYTVTLTVTNTANGKTAQLFSHVTIYPLPGGTISAVRTSDSVVLTPPAPPNCTEFTAGTPLNFAANATNVISNPPTQFLWQFGSALTSTLENPTNIVINQIGSFDVTLRMINANCTTTVVRCFRTGEEPVYNGGNFDGAATGILVECPPLWNENSVVFTGGPFDGASSAGALECPPLWDENSVVFTGGSLDGASSAGAIECPPLWDENSVVFTGGPFDGASSENFVECPPRWDENSVIWAGGPFDGADGQVDGINITTANGSTNLAVCSGNAAVMSVSAQAAPPNITSYAWYQINNTTVIGTTNTLTITPAINAQYAVRIVYDDGCTKTTDFNVSVINQPTANAGLNRTLCGPQTVQIGTPAVGAYIYTWSSGPEISATNIPQPTLNLTQPGTYTYTVTVTDHFELCGQATSSVTITINEIPNVNPGPDQTICVGQTRTLSASSTTTNVDYEFHEVNALNVPIRKLLSGGWQYRQAINITNSGTTLTNHQVRIVLNTAGLISAGKMQNSCNDLAFVSADGTTQLSHWIESGCNTTTTVVWVKVENLPASSTIYAYYGNSLAVNQQDGNNTFEFFDDFSGTTINTTKWTAATGSCFLNNGLLECPAAGGIFAGNFSLQPNMIIEALTNPMATNRIASGVRAAINTASGFTSYVGTGSVDMGLWADNRIYYYSNSGTWTTGPFFAADFRRYSIIYRPNGADEARYSYDNGAFTTRTVTNAPGTLFPTMYSHNGTTRWDYIYVRRFTTNTITPLLSGSEETISPVAGINEATADKVGKYAVRTTKNGCVSPWAYINITPGSYMANAGADTLICLGQNTQIGAPPPASGLIYSWLPMTGLSNPTVAQPFASPTVTTEYTLTMSVPGSGCLETTDAVVVTVQPLPNASAPDVSLCTGGTGTTITAASDISGSQFIFYRLDASDNILQTFPDEAITRSVTVTNANATTLTNHQVAITLNTAALVSANKMRTDCGDLRVYAANNLTILPHWIEDGTCNTPNTVIWVRIPTIPANSSINVNLRYKMPALTSTSNGDNVFEFFDDFNGATINTTKWTNSTGAVTQVGGFLQAANASGLFANGYTLPGEMVIETSAQSGMSCNGGAVRLASTSGVGWVNDPATSSHVMDILWWGTDLWAETFSGENSFGTFVTSGFRRYTINYRPDIHWASFIYDNGALSTTRSGLSPAGILKPVIYSSTCAAARWNWFLVRKFAPSQPTATVGTETPQPITQAANTVTVTLPGRYGVRAYAGKCPGPMATLNVNAVDNLAFHYRTKANGNWSDVNIWQVYDPACGNMASDACWFDAATFGACGGMNYPTSRSRTITVRHDVTYNLTYNTSVGQTATNNPYGIDETTVTTTGIITIPAGRTLALVDSSSSTVVADLQNNGRINIEGTFLPVGAGLLVNDDQSTVAYTCSCDQTMWNGIYGKLEAAGTGLKNVGGSATQVRTDVKFMGSHIRLSNFNLTLGPNATTTDGSCNNGFFITNQFGQVFKQDLGGAMANFTFPVGPASNSFNPITVTNSGTADRYGIRVAPQFDNDLNFSNDQLTAHHAVNRTWYVSEQNAGGSNLTITVNWQTAHENAGFNRTSAAFGEYDLTTGWQRKDAYSPTPGAGTCASLYSKTFAGVTVPTFYSVGSCNLVPIDYRTIANGNWTDVNIWEAWDMVTSSWLPASFINNSCSSVPYPTAESRYVDVRHRVTYNTTIPIGIDQVVLRSGAELIVPAGITLYFAAGSQKTVPELVSTTFPPHAPTHIPATDFYNDGKLTVTGAIEPLSGGILNNTLTSIVHYNGVHQNVWNGSYGHLWIDGTTPAAENHKTLIGNDVYVRTGLKFINGKIILGNFNCRLAENCLVEGAGQTTGYMVATSNGYCVWEYPAGLGVERVFPIGGNQYARCRIKFDEVTSGGTLLGRLREFRHHTLANAIKRYWTVTQGTIAFNGEYEGYFNYNDVDLPYVPTNIAEEHPMVVIGGVYSPAYVQPNHWRLTGNHLPVATHEFDINLGYIKNNAFSDFTFMPEFTPILPMDPLTLVGRWENDSDTRLDWKLEKLQPGAFYTLERADLTHGFTPIYTTHDTALKFTHYDKGVGNTHANAFLYRVKQQVPDGFTRYSNTVLLTHSKGNQKPDIRLYPSPVRSGDDITLAFTKTPKQNNLQVVIYDMAGKKVYDSKPFDATDRMNVSTVGLASGAYNCIVVNGQSVQTVRFLVVK